MKFLFLLSHPAHYHMFKNLMKQLRERNHDIKVLVRPKDVLEDLCINDSIDFEKLIEKPRKDGIINMGLSFIHKEFNLFKVVRKFNPDFLIGSDAIIAHVGFLFRKPCFEFSEDDAKEVKLYAFLSFPFYSNIISPLVCNNWLWKNKTIGYSGYQKLLYLAPKYFIPNNEILMKYKLNKPFFLMRFSNLSAHHDAGIKGIGKELALKIIKKLSQYGQIVISSEKVLDSELDVYRLKIEPQDIHHIMSYAKLFIGDSQSMSLESALLATPALRFSDFAGRLSVLEELEHRYDLTYGFKTDNENGLLNKIDLLLLNDNLKNEWLEKRDIMLNDKIDANLFLLWFFENYPNSKKILKENPDYQYNFK